MIYEGLNEEIGMMVESISNKGFLFQSPGYCWDLIEWFASDTYEWEMSLSARLILHPQ